MPAFPECRLPSSIISGGLEGDCESGVVSTGCLGSNGLWQPTRFFPCLPWGFLPGTLDLCTELQALQLSQVGMEGQQREWPLTPWGDQTQRPGSQHRSCSVCVLGYPLRLGKESNLLKVTQGL